VELAAKPWAVPPLGPSANGITTGWPEPPPSVTDITEFLAKVTARHRHPLAIGLPPTAAQRNMEFNFFAVIF
jgi:hypothetical protein